MATSVLRVFFCHKTFPHLSISKLENFQLCSRIIVKMSDSELSLTVWKRKALVEKRIRDVETQMNEMCNLVFGDVIQLFSEEDRVKGN